MDLQTMVRVSEVRKLGITKAFILAYVREYPEKDISTMANELEMTNSGLSAHLRELEQLGAIERHVIDGKGKCKGAKKYIGARILWS